MTKQKTGKKPYQIADLCTAMESIAPPALAQPWDNAGLLAGDMQAALGRVLLCIDLTPPVTAEAVAANADCVLAYHPPILKPVSRLLASGNGQECAVFHCVRSGIAVYATHTALDAADGGTNDVLARLCGIEQTVPLEYAAQSGREECKLVVYVPDKIVDRVAEAMFAAGAGRIGKYVRCSFRLPGEGTFYGGEGTNPVVGQVGRLERVDEIRLEAVVPVRDLPRAVAAMREAHSYEEPAYDIYPLRATPVGGIGRVGMFDKPTTLAALARRLKKAAGLRAMQIVGAGEAEVRRAIILAGAAGSLPMKAGLRAGDVVVTGEIRHHDALALLRAGATAIALGHWSSERPVLDALAERLSAAMSVLQIGISEADAEPFRPG